MNWLMQIQIRIVVLSVGLLLLCLCVALLSKILIEHHNKKIATDNLRKAAGIQDEEQKNFSCNGINNKVLNYMLKVAKTFEFSNDRKSIVSRFIKNRAFSYKISELVRLSGLPKNFNNIVYREVQFRLALFVGLALLLLGIVFSNFAGLIGLIAGICIGIAIPLRAMKTEVKVKTELVESELPEMLEVVSLCLRSGLSFDRSISLYIKHFTNELSDAFSLAINKWNGGILTREQSLKELSAKYDCAQLKRVIDNIIRSLRFGTALANGLEEAAVESRNLYKAKKEELVAKAPVKMMIPTGTLILPAMLLLVLGPVLLELVGGF